jgi:O-antigen/teichoic acid export membrane protein
MILYCWLVRRAWYIEHRLGRAVSSTLVYAVTLVGGIWALHLVGAMSPFAAFLVNGGAAITACWSFVPIITGTRNRTTESARTAGLALQNWRYGRWLVISSLLYWLTGNAYYVLTGSMLGLSDVGALRALQNLTNPVLQVVTAFGLLFMPWISRRFADQGRDALKKGIIMFSAASTAIAVVCLILILPTGRALVQILYKGKYLENAWLLPYIALVPVTVGLTSGWLVGLRILEKTSFVFLADIVGAVLTLTVGVAMVRSMGLTGAVIGIVVGSASRVIVLPLLWRAS